MQQYLLPTKRTHSQKYFWNIVFFSVNLFEIFLLYEKTAFYTDLHGCVQLHVCTKQRNDK